jgi:uncharacterized protein YdgA (DUF945 family)
MKKLTGLVIILAVLVLGGYYGMGVLTEKIIKKKVEVINQSNGLFADIKQYNRGWFSSTTQIQWRLHVPERIVKDESGVSKTVPAQDYQMEMPIRIFHGPIIYANKGIHFGMGYAQTVFPFPDQYNAQFDELFTKESTKPQLDLSIFVSYLANTTVELALPQFNLISKDGTGHFDWMGMESTTTASRDEGKVKGDIVIEGVKLSKTDTNITLGKVSAEYDLHQTLPQLYLGDASFLLPSLDVVVKDKKMFELSDFSVSSTSDVDKNLFYMDVDISLKSAMANDKSYGPGELKISLRNIDAEALARLNEKSNAIQNGTEAEKQRAMCPGLVLKSPKARLKEIYWLPYL